MTLAQRFVLLVALGAWPCAMIGAAAPVAEAGVVQVEAPVPADADWQGVEDARGSTRWAQALTAYLALHPHGDGASRALQEQAALEDDLDKAASLLRRAREEGREREAGAAAALTLARLDYAQGRPEAALLDQAGAESWPRADALRDEWLYWRAQSRLVLKGFRRAREDFQRLLTVHPHSPRAEAALVGRADCDLALKDYAAAEEAWIQLAKSNGPFAAQSLFDLAGLRVRQGRADEARKLYRQVLEHYPASFEAEAAPTKLKALAKAPMPKPAPTEVPRPLRWWVQVGAFSRSASAQRLAAGLRKHRWPVAVQERRSDGHRLYLVKVGPYVRKAQAEAAVRRLGSREKLPQRLVEE